LNLLYWSYIFS